LGRLIFAVVFWGSIRLLDGKDPRNKFSLALFFGVLFGLFGLIPGASILWFIPYVAIWMLLLNYYQLSFLRILCVIAILLIKDASLLALHMTLILNP